MTTTGVADVSTSGFIPPTQRSWRVVRRGEPSTALILDNEAPVPTLKSGEVLVRVQAVSFNNVYVSPLVSPTEHMVLTVPSVYFLMKLLPNSFVKRPAELEFAGEIVDAASSSGFAPGDKVSGLITPDVHVRERRGALAQYIAVKPGELVKRPEFLSPVEASGVLCVGLAAYQALFEVARLRQEPGQSVFINGGSTSIGIYAIQLAKAYGLKVVASASGRNAKMVTELGAEVCTSYSYVVLQFLTRF